MNNIDSYKEYIQDSIINHLERLMGNDVVDDVNLWEKYGSKGLTPQKDSAYQPRKEGPVCRVLFMPSAKAPSHAPA